MNHHHHHHHYDQLPPPTILGGSHKALVSKTLRRFENVKPPHVDVVWLSKLPCELTSIYFWGATLLILPCQLTFWGLSCNNMFKLILGGAGLISFETKNFVTPKLCMIVAVYQWGGVTILKYKFRMSLGRANPRGGWPCGQSKAFQKHGGFGLAAKQPPGPFFPPEGFQKRF